jgi:2-haloacid dehalogenase
VGRWATFDCYGTLVDWHGGIRAELARLWPDQAADALLRRYHELEPELQRAEPGLSYGEVMRRVLARLGDVPAGEEDALGDALPGWDAFPDVAPALTEARRRGWKLAILSNTDPEFIEASKARIGVPFDETIVASEIGSYKPAHRHWREFEARTGAGRGGHVHVAQSVFHDIVPAQELGLPTVWINRLGESADAEPTRELPDLVLLPDVLDELVPL